MLSIVTRVRKVLPQYFLLVFIFPLFLFSTANAQVPDWSTSVASIIYDNCSKCHHEGAIAPFSLMSYNDAVTNAFSIQSDINVRKMPPWPPDPNYTHLRNEMVLSSSEITTINDWVNGGMPLGDTTLAPAPPVYNGASLMTVIDDTLIFPAYTVPTDLDDYRAFCIHSGWTETKYLNQIEFLPSNPGIVHHLFLFHDPTQTSWLQEVADTAPGFYGGFLDGFSPTAVTDAGWIPGSSVFSFPANMGIQVKPGSDFIVNIHYAPGSLGKTTDIKVHIKWCDIPDTLVRHVNNARLLHWHPPSLENPPFQMPPNEVVTFYEESPIYTKDQTIIAFQPHMHLIGKSFEVFMVGTNNDTTKIVYIPSWNFNWQMGYFPFKLIKFPAGARVYGIGVYDNTVNNPNNPNSPPQWVYAGESTYDEMMSCRFDLMDYLPGDENIVLGDTSVATGTVVVPSKTLSLALFPNPASSDLYFSSWLPENNVYWTLTNSMGKIVKASNEKRVFKGAYAQDLDISTIPSGIYLFTIESGSQRLVRKVIVMR